MTSSHFILGWAAYLVGATGCLVSLILITRRLSVRVKRALRFAAAALLYTPWWLTAGSDLLSPALFTMMYDGMTHGVEAMTRAGLITLITAGAALLIAIILPVKAKKAPVPSGHQQPPKRQEPTC
ncbi:hypothetical protein [Endozoicomonas sp. 4G]|uniref:hypothetical protein n=1 Tax=Endozoicomonas sp. 4G TaxID=2872754 RepID=UPI002078F1D3|nr:hypothetical protein [Endozoicomonas sp. 4G]